MPAYNSAAMLPLTAGLTLVGLVVAYLIARKQGKVAAIQPAAWALVPVGLHLTGLLRFLWTTVDAAVTWLVKLVFSPSVWAGFAILALAGVLWVVGGVAKRKTGPAGPDAAGLPAEVTEGNKQRLPKPKKSAAPAPDDDFDEIEAILKRRGIS